MASDEQGAGSATATAPRAAAPPRARRRSRVHGAALAVLLVGFALTAAASVTTNVIYNRNENRLLALRVNDAGAAIAGAIPSIETPLASADELAQATGGDTRQFDRYMAAALKLHAGAVSGSLWALSPGHVALMAKVGVAPEIAADRALASTFFTRTARSGLLGSMIVTGPTGERIGYAYAPKGSSYLVYEETSLNPSRRAPVASDSSFANLHYAIYFGRREAPADLLATDEAQLPITGRRASVSVPFGTGSFLLVMTPGVSLGGTFFADLKWIVLGLGLLITLGAAWLVERLVRRRAAAEAIAGERDAAAREVVRLYDEQRHIAETLQHALLPESIPPLPGVEIGARYLPGVRGMDIGGDWYDVVGIDDDRFLLVVGDVSGRGLRAATVMAELRYSIRAYLAGGDSPAGILTKLTQLHDLESDGHFATVLLALADQRMRTLTIANAGHLNPLLLADGACRSIATVVGAPVGVSTPLPYSELEVDLPPYATFVAFTDGLVERRGQLIDESLAELTSMINAEHGSLGELLDNVVVHAGAYGSDDDTAILGVRWLN